MYTVKGRQSHKRSQISKNRVENMLEMAKTSYYVGGTGLHGDLNSPANIYIYNCFKRDKNKTR